MARTTKTQTTSTPAAVDPALLAAFSAFMAQQQTAKPVPVKAPAKALTKPEPKWLEMELGQKIQIVISGKKYILGRGRKGLYCMEGEV